MARTFQRCPPRPALTGRERILPDGDLIVSKTDRAGTITYANRVFQTISGYSESELLGAPHSIVRHPAMPRCVFKFLWDTIEAGQEVFAYVLNLGKSGDHYWVFAHVTPTTDGSNAIVGYHSCRRAPKRDAITKIEPVYQQLLEVEARHARPAEAAQAGLEALVGLLQQSGVTYEKLVFSL